ncbi:hypothetical protein ACIOWF_20135 [Cellulosimicrobium cellulans]|uniref:hypothetical protein n=1 Tax=Cellulosimicrobium cellulans TaxID=1710 RepID=UPI00381685D2
MSTHLPSQSHDSDVLTPTLWGYAVTRVTTSLLGEVPGLPPHIVGRTDVVLPGLTPPEMERVRRFVQWRARARPGRLTAIAALATCTITLMATAALTGRAQTLTALIAAIGALACAAAVLRSCAPHLTRTENYALRRAVEVRRVRTSPASSSRLHVLSAMSAVEDAAGALDETGQALARELLWSAVDALRIQDSDQVRHATAAMIRLSVRATQATRDDFPRGPLT